MNSENSKTSDPGTLPKLSDKKDLTDEYVALSNLSIYASKHLSIMEKYKNSFKNNKFKITTRTWNEKFELPGGSYFASDI